MNAHALKVLRVSLLAAALAVPAAPAVAQHQGHVMPMPAAKPAAKKAVSRPAVKKAVPTPAAKPAAKPAAAKKPAPHAGGSMQGMDHSNMHGMHRAPAAASRARKPAPKAAARPAARASKTHGMDHSKMPGMSKPAAPKRGARKPAAKPAAGAMQDMDHLNMPGMGKAASAATAGSHAADHSKMEGMDHSSMAGADHGAKGHADPDLPADAAPRTPIPALTDADRAAAFPPNAHGHEVHDQRAHSYWLVDRLEWQDTEEGSLGWEGLAWIGGDIDRVWLRTEGEAAEGEIESANAEVLYGHAISPWWDAVAGVRHDFGEGPSRTYAAFGVQGLAPYKFEVEATAFVGANGRGGVTLEGEYDTLITNRLILQWQAETTLHAKDDPEIGVGSGVSTVEAGVRLRYELSRRFSPYVGVGFERAFGGTADLRREHRQPTRDTRLVAGIRFWF